MLCGVNGCRESAFARAGSLKGKEDTNFLFGYFTHILTDIAHTSDYSERLLVTCDDHAAKEDFYNDSVEVDSILKQRLDFPKILTTSKTYSLPDYAEAEDITAMIERMLVMYRDRFPREGYVYKTDWTFENADKFIGYTANEILELTGEPKFFT